MREQAKGSLFLTCLLALLAGRPRFRLMLNLAIGLIVDLTIGKAKSMGREVAVGFSTRFLWNELITFLRYCTAKTGF